MWLQILIAVSTVVGALGGAAVVANTAKKAFTTRRERVRKDEILWGYRDENGTLHEGFVAAVQAHMANEAIHRAATR